MVFVRRDNGVIAGVYGARQEYAQEELPDDNPEVQSYLNPPSAIDSVTARQFKMQLAIMGIKGNVDAWVASQDELVQIAYEYSGTFVKSEPMMLAGFNALGFTSKQLEDFFLAASKL